MNLLKKEQSHFIHWDRVIYKHILWSDAFIKDTSDIIKKEYLSSCFENSCHHNNLPLIQLLSAQFESKKSNHLFLGLIECLELNYLDSAEWLIDQGADIKFIRLFIEKLSSEAWLFLIQKGAVYSDLSEVEISVENIVYCLEHGINRNWFQKLKIENLWTELDTHNNQIKQVCQPFYIKDLNQIVVSFLIF